MHDHDHHDHSHSVSADADRRWLAIALGIILTFFVVEVVAGFVANSLALLSDAAHMLTDAGSIALALFAAGLAARPPSRRYTFGLGRAEILAGVIGVEAIQRLGDPPDVEGGVVIVVGVIGGLANVGAAWALSRSERKSLNVEGAMQHVLMDLYGSIAAVVAGVLVLVADFRAADGIAALIVSLLMLRSGWRLLRDSVRVLLEGTPSGLDTETVGRTLAAQPGVVEVHDLHIWEVTSGFPALAAHVLVREGDDCHRRRRELELLLSERYHVEHTTLQVEHEHPEALLEIERVT